VRGLKDFAAIRDFLLSDREIDDLQGAIVKRRERRCPDEADVARRGKNPSAINPKRGGGKP